jgi:hypothetical protein
MARCKIPDGLNHETMRFNTMSNPALYRRLGTITKPEKLACFLRLATVTRKVSLFQQAIYRCHSLGYVAVEYSPGWHEVVPVDQVRREETDTNQRAIEKARRLAEEERRRWREEKPKKKKSLYSRKLRVKRRD